MTLEKQLQEMGRRFGIEAPHTEQVTRLALDVFDGFAPWPDLRSKDRDILLAAGQLHDIGYASAPENHVEEGLRILLENPLPDFTPRRWKTVVAVVSLHRRDWKKALEDERLSDVGEKRWARAKALAAMLRIGDGLDHSHVQDTCITACRRRNRMDQIEVECGWYAGNISWAEGKSDLWEAVFRRPLRFKGTVLHRGLPYPVLLDGSESAVAAVRKMLYAQYDIMRDQVPGLREKHDHEALHTYRRALRRFRAGLHFFKPLLVETSARKADGLLDAFNRQLGPFRDRHVLQAFLEAHPDIEGLGEVRTRRAAEIEEADEALAALMDSEACGEAVRTLNRLLRVELPALEDGSPRYRPFAKKRLGEVLKTPEAPDPEGLLQTPQEMHALRKQYRKVRYMAECAIPSAGRPAKSAAKKCKRMVSALGTLRDLQQVVEALRLDQPGLASHPVIEHAQQAACRRLVKARKDWNEA